jgi:ABC-type dipeptide/oligopeptide/nickel transport system permease subunit
VVGLIIVVAWAVAAIFAPLLTPYDPYTPDLEQSLAQPSREHLLGADLIGRDILTRVIYGSRLAFMICIVAVGSAALIGSALGLVAAYYGGILNMVIMRLVDALMSIPMIVKALLLGALLGGGMTSTMIAIGFVLMSIYARLICGVALSIKELDYVTAARAAGASNLRIILYHILPNSIAPLIVQITLQLGFALLLEAAMSFIGVGVSPPAAAWGSMISQGYEFLIRRPILCLAPGLAIMSLVFGFNMIGDGLRDAMDPRLRGTL